MVFRRQIKPSGTAARLPQEEDKDAMAGPSTTAARVDRCNQHRRHHQIRLHLTHPRRIHPRLIHPLQLPSRQDLAYKLEDNVCILLVIL